MIENSCSTCFPLHGNGVVGGNRKFTDLSSNSVHGPLTEAGLGIDIELEVHQSLGNSGVDEQHSILLDVLDQVRG